MLIKRIQLGLIHVAVAMTLVPINSTLNRVMIKELAISAALVAVLASLPYLFSPVQVAIGSFSDRHPLFGLRRTPYILLGLILCVTGVILSPQAAFWMVENFWVGIGLATLAFGAWGMGFNFATVSYLSLATELSGEKGRSRTISVMWFMMILGIIATSITLGRLLETYTPQTLQRAFEVVAMLALTLGLVGLARLEKRDTLPVPGEGERTSWLVYGKAVAGNPQARRFFIYQILLLAAILGQDILLEPFGAEAFGFPVSITTRLTSLWGACFLVALLLAGLLEGKVSKRRMVVLGSWSAIASLGMIAFSGLLGYATLFYIGVIVLGLATGISTVSNLSLMLDMTVEGSAGLFIGAWGMANALARAVGALVGGVTRDLVSEFSRSNLYGYVVVFFLEVLMLLGSLWLLRGIDVGLFRRSAAAKAPARTLPLVERMSLSQDA